MRLFLNPAVQRTDIFRGLFSADEYEDVRRHFTNPLHRGDAPTPLRRLDTLARRWDVGQIAAKDETDRQSVNAFKILGVSYAVARMGGAAARRGLVCATAGNHGRAVARVARMEGVPCTVFLPVARTSDPIELDTRRARVEAMRQDQAAVIEVDGTYEDAVHLAAACGAGTGATVVSDTWWDGYEQIPRWIMAGYTRLFEEVSQQWDARPDLVIIQGGVGGLVCAAVSWFAARYGASRPFMIAAEPEQAACLLESAKNGAATRIGGSLDTIMAGLRCAEPSPLAWPTIAAGVDAFVTVTDTAAVETMALLERSEGTEKIHAGPSGVCGLAAMRQIALAPELHELRCNPRVDWRQSSASLRALVVITEGSLR